MIDLNQIELFYPKTMRSFKSNLLREYFQHKILEIIYGSKWFNKLVFMGGTSLRIVHSLNRFSEDLDFDNIGLKEKDFKELARFIVKRLKLEGYEVDVKIVLKKAFHAHIQISDMLYKAGISGHKSAKITISIDTQPQSFSYCPSQVLINKFDIFLKINVVPIDILLSQKIYAAVSRKRTMGRDFFDIIFLMGRTKPNLDYLKLKMNVKDESDLKERLLKFCSRLDFKRLAEDVDKFLIVPQDAKKILLFEEYVSSYDFKL